MEIQTFETLENSYSPLHRGNMVTIDIHPSAKRLAEQFKLPDTIGFGTLMAPIMVTCDWEHGKWQQASLVPYGPITLAPTAKVLHYAQEIFEGLKAYKVDNKGPYLFRPELNAKRFNHSARRMGMPDFPEELFLEACKEMTRLCTPFIPTGSGQSLYLRPFMFATEESLGIKASQKYKFLCIASPSGAYFAKDTMPVLIERKAVRASPGGTGTAKTGGNYAGSLLSSKKAHELGCLQTLWLDSLKKEYIEEMSGMNFMAVIDGVLHTPELNDTILDGITRESIISHARFLGIPVSIKKMEINKLIEDIKSQKCTEAFACGTAAIITPIEALVEEDGTSYKLVHSKGPIGQKLRKELLDLQEGRAKDPHGWRVSI